MNPVAAGGVSPAVEGARTRRPEKSFGIKSANVRSGEPIPPGKMPGSTAGRRPAATASRRFMIPMRVGIMTSRLPMNPENKGRPSPSLPSGGGEGEGTGLREVLGFKAREFVSVSLSELKTCLFHIGGIRVGWGDGKNSQRSRPTQSRPRSNVIPPMRRKIVDNLR